MKTEDFIAQLCEFHPHELLQRMAYRWEHGLQTFPPEEEQKLQEYIARPKVWEVNPLQQDGSRLLKKEFFLRDLPVRVMRHSRYMPKNFHKHDFFEMPVVLSGRCEQIYRGVTYPLEEGDLCIMAPNTAHMIYVADDDSIVLNVLFERELFDQLLGTLLEEQNAISNFLAFSLSNDQAQHQIIIHVGKDEMFLQLLQAMYWESAQDKPLKGQVLASYCNLLLSSLIRDHWRDIKAVDMEANEDSEIICILSYLQKHYQTTSLKEMAQEFHYSEHHLGKKIKQFTNKTFSETVLELKLSNASRQLRSTDWTVEKIAKESGFFDLSHFNRRFKEHYGTTPGRYREKTTT